MRGSGTVDVFVHQVRIGHGEPSAADWAADLRQRLGTALREGIAAAERFYDARGVRTAGLREAAARGTLARAVRARLEEALRVIHRQLADATVAAIEEQVLAGRIDRTALADRIEALTGTSATFARVQAQAAVGALNQTYREAVAERAGLSFYHYYGTAMDNTRPFCRIHIGYVYERRRILQMRNGMLEPVLTFKGGFNCRHAWLPVDPAWSDDLASRVVDAEPREIWLDTAGNRRITIVAPDGRVTRLVEQIKLQRLGFVRFYDAAENETGYVALHQDWIAERDRTRAGSPKRLEFDRELRAGFALADAGHRVRADTNVKNNIGGPSDLVVDGTPADVKTVEEPITATGFRDRIRRSRKKQGDHTVYQSDVYVFDPEAKPDPTNLALATQDLASWLRRNRARRAFIIHTHADRHVHPLAP